MLKLEGNLQARNSVLTVPWFVPGSAGLAPSSLPARTPVSLFQLGPKPDRIPPVPTSNPTTRLTGFKAVLKTDGSERTGDRTDGWLDVFDSRRGVAFGLKNFVEEYRIRFDPATGQFNAFFWSPEAGPMSFAPPQQRAGAGSHRELGAGHREDERDARLLPRHGQGRRRSDDGGLAPPWRTAPVWRHERRVATSARTNPSPISNARSTTLD
jgi:hypothetical protein